MRSPKTSCAPFALIATRFTARSSFTRTATGPRMTSSSSRSRARRSAPCLVVLEDLDALIEDQNRAFLLNELDGFADNEGVVVIASTNHPEKLDPAILDRPSRFDRKYRFDLPALAERLVYVKHWNRTLQLEMQLTD